MGKCKCGRAIPNGCPNCPPKWIRCQCGEMILIEPDESEYIKDIIKQYKKRG